MFYLKLEALCIALYSQISSALRVGADDLDLTKDALCETQNLEKHSGPATVETFHGKRLRRDDNKGIQ
jgi:hypothetical protein